MCPGELKVYSFCCFLLPSSAKFAKKINLKARSEKLSSSFSPVLNSLIDEMYIFIYEILLFVMPFLLIHQFFFVTFFL